MADDSEPPTCFSCTLQLTQTIHVRCNECPVRICMLCFQCGAESVPQHRRGHNYELLRPYNDSDGTCWTHEDEFELLKAAHKFKMGNWGEIAESIGRGRRDGQNCKDYFEKHFVRGWIGQYSIKLAHWTKTKYEMCINQTLDTVLQKNCLESTERMLLIADSIRDSGEILDVQDAKLGAKVQQLLEKYVQKCLNNEVEVKYERPKALKGQYETELTPDPLDPEEGTGGKSKKTVKLDVKAEAQTDDSDVEDTAGPSCSTRRSGGPPSPKKRKTSRVMRESSTDSEKTPSDNDTFHGLERETEDEDHQSDFETAAELDSDEEGETKAKKGATPGRRKKRKRLMMSKKERRLSEFRKKMKRDENKAVKQLNKHTHLCSVKEMKELRRDFPRLIHENGVSRADRPKIRQNTDLNLLGYNIEREEFETEWFNEAEMLISRLTISAAPPDCDERLDWENDIKFDRLRHYIRLLGIRKAKRNTILEHDKINEFIRWYKEACLISKNKSMTEAMESRSKKEKLLVMTQQFLKRDEYLALRASLDKIDTLVEKIKRLQKLQRDGETTLRNAPVERRTKKKVRKIDAEHQKKVHMEWKKHQKWHTDGFQ